MRRMYRMITAHTLTHEELAVLGLRARDIIRTPAPVPTSIDELTSHTMASRTPHALTFTEDERGNIGEWSDIQSAVIP